MALRAVLTALFLLIDFSTLTRWHRYFRFILISIMALAIHAAILFLVPFSLDAPFQISSSASVVTLHTHQSKTIGKSDEATTSQQTDPTIIEPQDNQQHSTEKKKPVHNNDEDASAGFTPPANAKLTVFSPIDYSSISDTIEILESQKPPVYDSTNSRGILFDPELSNQLSERQDEQSNNAKHKERLSEKQKEAFWEFRTAGDVKIIRIDGKCFLTQEKDPLDEFHNPIFLFTGNCTKKKQLTFKSYKPEDNTYLQR